MYGALVPLQVGNHARAAVKSEQKSSVLTKLSSCRPSIYILDDAFFPCCRQVIGAKFSLDGNRVASVGWDSYIKVIDQKPPKMYKSSLSESIFMINPWSIKNKSTNLGKELNCLC